jgi:hypothetical protein
MAAAVLSPTNRCPDSAESAPSLQAWLKVQLNMTSGRYIVELWHKFIVPSTPDSDLIFLPEF